MRRPLAVLGFLSLAALFLGHCALALATSFNIEGTRYFVLADDSMISMRFAHNLVHFHDFSWNPGDRVQGYTNLGWTLLMALVHLLPLPLEKTSLVVQLLGGLIHVALTLVTFRITRRLAGTFPAVLAGFVTALHPSLWYYGWAGFETPLQCLLVTLAFSRLLPSLGDATEPDRASTFPLWMGLAFVVRPDALLLLGLGTAALFARELLRRRGSAQGAPDGSELRRLIGWSAVAAVLVAAVFLFQYAYYGSWLPNTAYLKTTGGARNLGRGLRYLGEFLVQDRQLPLVLGALGYVLSGLKQGRRVAFLLPGGLLAAWFAYVVWTGGDVFYLSRFFLPLIPVLIICSAAFAQHVLRDRFSLERRESVMTLHLRTTPLQRRELGVLAVLALTGVMVLVSPYQLFTLQRQDREVTRSLLTIAHVLRTQVNHEGRVAAVFWAGVPAYFVPDMRFHDLLGKSDSRIAHMPAKWGRPGHNKWDYDYSLGEVRPDLIITGAREYQLSGEADPSTCAPGKAEIFLCLWVHPEFQRQYAGQLLPIRSSGPQLPEQHRVYVRAGALPSLLRAQ